MNPIISSQGSIGILLKFGNLISLSLFKLDADIIRSYINDPNIGYSKVEKILDVVHALRYQIPRVVGMKELSDEEIKANLIEEYYSGNSLPILHSLS